MFDLTFDLKDAVLAYLKSQTNYNTAAVARMEYETKLQEQRLEAMEKLKETLAAGSGAINLGDLLDPSDDDS